MAESVASTPPPASSTEVRTFLIADVRGYTHFTVEHGDEAAARLATRFARITTETVASRSGEVIELRGDEALAVFTSARQALRAAVELQGRFAEASIADPTVPLRVGIGLDAGEAIPVEGGYRGAALNLAARLCSLAAAQEVLVSDTVTNLARKLDGLEYAERGFAQLKGFDEPIRVIAVLARQDTTSPATETTAEQGRTPEQRLPIGGFLGALPSGVLVGRDEELARGVAAIEVVAGGTGQLVLLAGEPGVGKTRLAQEMTLQLRDRNFLLAAGRCYEPQISVPFYPFLDALSALFTAAPAALRANATQQWPYLGKLLPDLMPGAPISAETPDDQQRLFRAVAGFLTTLAQEAPVALLLDDLHWADRSSLDLLQYLARQTRGDRILLLGTYRDVELGRHHPLESALRDLGREGLATRIEVRRLGEESTSALLAETLGEADVSSEFAELIYQRTEGNPFFVQQVVRVLVEHGDVYREAGNWQRKSVGEMAVPESIRAVVGQRLERLDETAQEILREASVLGQSFSFDDLEAMSGRSEDELDDALKQACRSALTRDVDGESYAFDHALTQQTLYAELTVRRRRRLHLAAGEGIERLPDPKRERRAAELAGHFLHADQTERATPWALLAGDQAEALFAHTEAEWQYRTALELAQESENARREAEAREKLGSVLNMTGRSDEALEYLTRALAMYETWGDSEDRARSGAALGWAHADRGSFAEGIATIRELLASLDDGASSSALATLWVVLSTLLYQQNNLHEALAAAEQAAKFAQQAGDDRLLGQAEGRRGLVLNVMGRHDETLPVLERAIVLAEAAGDLAMLGRAFNNLGGVYSDRGDSTSARKYIERGFEVAVRAGAAHQTSFLGQILAYGVIELGDWEAGRRYAEQTLAALRHLGESTLAAAPLLTLANLNREQGNEGEAGRCFAEAAPLAAQSNEWEVSWAMENTAGKWEIEDGQANDAVARFERLIAEPDLHRYPLFWFSELLVHAYLAAGMNEKADEAAQRLGELAPAYNQSAMTRAARRVLANVRARQGRWEEAEEAFDDALTEARRVGEAFPEAMLLHEYGLAEQEKGDRVRARDLLQQALVIFERIGAVMRAGKTEQALADLG